MIGSPEISLDSSFGLGISATVLVLSVVTAYCTVCYFFIIIIIIDQEAKDRNKRKEMGWDDEYLVSFNNIQTEQTNRKIKMTIIIKSNVKLFAPEFLLAFLSDT